MSGNPWMKFYPRDWRGDQALRAVSIAARGLWLECLCIMHEAKPYGHLMLNGNPVGDDALARMAGVPVDEVLRLMAELRQAGVLSVTREGVVFSRRMTKDHARAQKGKAAVKKRWNAAKSVTPQAPETEQKSGAPNRPLKREPITQKPEARSQKKENAIAFSSPNDDFEAFWQTYPHRGGAKKGRKEALQRFAAAVKAGAEPSEIIIGAGRYQQDRQVLSGFAKDPATWLNNRCWTDEVEPLMPRSGDHGAAATDEAKKLAKWDAIAKRKEIDQ